MNVEALRQLAHDIAANFGCACYVDDLAHGVVCPCGGSGREEAGADGTFEGCWHCQALAALAVPNDSPQPAVAADPTAPVPPAATAAHVETGGAPSQEDDRS